MVETRKLIRSLISDQEEIIGRAQGRIAELRSLLEQDGDSPILTRKPRGGSRNSTIMQSIFECIGSGNLTKEEIVSELSKKFDRRSEDELQTLRNTITWNLSQSSKPGGRLIAFVDTFGKRQYRIRRTRKLPKPEEQS